MKIKYEDKEGRKYEILCVEEEMRGAGWEGDPESIAHAFGHHHSIRKGSLGVIGAKVESEEGDESHENLSD